MKQTGTGWLLVAGWLALAGCDGGEAVLPEGGTGSLELLSVSVPGEKDTKSETTQANLSSLGVYATKADHTAYSDRALMTYDKSNGLWSCSSPVNLTAEAGGATVYAFSPATLAVTNEGTGNHTVPVTVARTLDFSSSGQPDFLYGVDGTVQNSTAQPTASTTSRSVSFRMRHALAKVSLVVKKASSAQNDAMELTEVRLLSGTNRMQTGSGRMLLKDGKLLGLVATDTLIVKGKTTLSANQTAANVTCLVAPMSGTEQVLSFRLKVEVEGIEREFVTSTLSGGAAWEAGKQYTYTLTLNKMGGSLTDMRVEDWKTDANQNTSIGI